jgi:uncharacterized membrane protein|tara:strand:+ start:565 stop:744 length:180 start_codon:yes stop_codon:yes gene_type:complete
MTKTEFYNLLLKELNDMQDYVLCPMDILDTVENYMEYYVTQEVNKRIDEIDDTIKSIKL